MRILAVDDDDSLLGAVELMLKRHGHDVEAAGSAREALECVKTGSYDFVLLDYKMPEEDGIWFMEQAELPRDTKVLLTTAYANRAMIQRIFELGAVGYIVKPFSEEDILHHLEFHSRPQPPPTTTI